MSTTPILDRQFLVMRAKILELAADLDRLDRAGEIAAEDSRLGKLREALQVLLDEAPQRAAHVQQIFSRDYDPQWTTNLGVPARD